MSTKSLRSQLLFQGAVLDSEKSQLNCDHTILLQRQRDHTVMTGHRKGKSFVLYIAQYMNPHEKVMLVFPLCREVHT